MPRQIGEDVGAMGTSSNTPEDTPLSARHPGDSRQPADRPHPGEPRHPEDPPSPGSPLRPVLYAFLSAIFPGAGQLVNGARRRGLALVGLALLVAVVAGVLFLAYGVNRTLAWAIEPKVLLGLLVLNVALLGFRLFAVLDAFRSTRRPPPPSPEGPTWSRLARRASLASRRLSLLVVSLLAFLLLLTALPHVAAGYYLYVSHDLITSLFTSEEKGETPTAVCTSVATSLFSSATSSSLPTSAPGSSTVTSSGAPSFPTTTSSTSASTSSTTLTTAPPETEPLFSWDDDGRLTVILIGTDAGYGRKGARADSIMVATADLQTGRVALFSVPRNTGSVPLSAEAARVLGQKQYVNLISSLYFDANEHPELAPEGLDAGAVVLRDSVSMLLGIPIDHYAVVDMGGFVKLIDALGGVTLNVKERVWVRLSPPTAEEEWRVYDIKPGIRHLSGLEALAFARSRTGSSDYVRMGRQRCIIAALIYQNGAAEVAWKFPALAEVLKQSLKTDIPLSMVQELIKARSRLKTDKIITVGFTPPKYTDGVNSMGYNILDLDLVQATVRKIIERPEEFEAAEGGGESLDTYDCWKVD